jgi:hypothetical protein
MKKLLLILSIFIGLKGVAQIPNGDFEIWDSLSMAITAGEFCATQVADTANYFDPASWTTSNAISTLHEVGNIVLVTRSTQHQTGTYSIQMRTDSIVFDSTLAPCFAGFTGATLPGFAVSGTFPITPLSLISGGLGEITPADLKGAGQPVSQRLNDIRGYFNYTPVFNNNTHSNDTCVIWATLRKGPLVVANAIWKYVQTTVGFQAFQANFNYVSCEMPDTLVVLMSSSSLSVTQILNRATGLVSGSVLLVDTLAFDTVPPGFTLPPFAVNDTYDSILEHSVNNTLKVLANDTVCSGGNIAVSIHTSPIHGTATVSNNEILYTPDSTFFGRDTLVYTDSAGGGTANATVYITVLQVTGISSVNQIAVNIYPVPADNVLNVNFENPGKTYLRVYDMVGHAVYSSTVTANENHINTANFANGFYAIELVNENNAIVARAKFIISR